MEQKKPSNYDLQVDLARKVFLDYDHAALLRRLGLPADTLWVTLEYLHTPCRVSREDGRVEEYLNGAWQECRRYSTVMTIYDLLCHPSGDTLPALTGSWCTVSDFAVTGGPASDHFTRRYAALFQGRIEALKAACEQMGGTLLPPMARADVTCRIPVTAFFPLILQFWEGDDEFPPKVLLLWDKNSMAFLLFETSYYLQGDLLGRLGALVENA